ncbi:hypothetical protein BKA66DRAFT_604930 [Pyrenochaeta sp. MPI-SDFR-AT-0127]|nr:hypothetical protein BKA66DRAFT_604930 [Pyrenochaeta sp. MPI-SDFR-AT-0127]
MQFYSIVFLSFAAMVMATPTAGKYVQTRAIKPLGLRNVADAAQTCGDKKVLSCCNQNKEVDSSKSISGNALGDDILNFNCAAIQLQFLNTGDATANEVCGDKSEVKCCDGNAHKVTIFFFFILPVRLFERGPTNAYTA